MRLKKLTLALLLPLLLVSLTGQRFGNRRMSSAGSTFYDRVRETRPDVQIIWPFDERSGTSARAVTGLQANILANAGFELRPLQRVSSGKWRFRISSICSLARQAGQRGGDFRSSV